jgi:hypothetical protein
MPWNTANTRISLPALAAPGAGRFAAGRMGLCLGAAACVAQPAAGKRGPVKPRSRRAPVAGVRTPGLAAAFEAGGRPVQPAAPGDRPAARAHRWWRQAPRRRAHRWRRQRARRARGPRLPRSGRNRNVSVPGCNPNHLATSTTHTAPQPTPMRSRAAPCAQRAAPLGPQSARRARTRPLTRAGARAAGGGSGSGADSDTRPPLATIAATRRALLLGAPAGLLLPAAPAGAAGPGACAPFAAPAAARSPGLSFALSKKDKQAGSEWGSECVGPAPAPGANPARIPILPTLPKTPPHLPPAAVSGLACRHVARDRPLRRRVLPARRPLRDARDARRAEGLDGGGAARRGRGHGAAGGAAAAVRAGPAAGRRRGRQVGGIVPGRRRRVGGLGWGRGAGAAGAPWRPSSPWAARPRPSAAASRHFPTPLRHHPTGAPSQPPGCSTRPR